MRTLALTLAAVAIGLSAMAQEKATQEKAAVSTPKLSGYAITQYQATNQDAAATASSFSLRMIRLSADGRLPGDFVYKLQAQINGNTSTLGNSPRIVDAFVEWQKRSDLRIKAGQFKRPFTLENPMHPIDQGFMSYSQAVTALSGFNDRTGEHASNGRDIGIQVQGDILATTAGRPLLHYQAGVFNGQGINVKDVDNRKDIIGGCWVMPINGLRLAVFGWEGSYARKGSDGIVRLRQHRYAISGDYTRHGWTLRTEYIHSTGLGFKTTYNEKADLSDATINTANGSRADGYYALAIAPIAKQRAHLKLRYDLYRKAAEWASSKAMYELGADYLITKGLQLNIEYALVNDRSLQHHNYNIIDCQLSFRF